MGGAAALSWALLLMRIPQTQLTALKVSKLGLSRQVGAGVQAGANGAGAVGRVGEAVLLAPVRHFVVFFVCKSSYADLASDNERLLSSLGVKISDHDSPGVVCRR